MAHDPGANASAGAPAGRAFYRPELDGLRFMAFLSVFVCHALPRTAGPWSKLGSWTGWIPWVVGAGQWGLDLFFALSSYLITELLLREIERRGALDVRAFWIRRGLRIWPLYFSFVAFATLVVPLFVYQRVSGVQTLTFVTFTANWAAVVSGALPVSVMAPLWSISIEEQFYFCWPLMVRRLSVQRLSVLVAGLLLVAFLARVVLISRSGDALGFSIWCNTLTRLDPIALGALVAIWSRRRSVRLGAGAAWALLLGGPMLVVATMSIADGLGARPVLASVVYLVNGLACAGVLLSVIAGPPGHARFLTRAPVVYLGRISYGLYVFHHFMVLVADHLRDDHLASLGAVSFPLAIMIALVGTVALASASYRWLEAPFLRLKERFAVIRTVPLSAQKLAR